MILIKEVFLGSIVVSIPACHAGDRGSIPRRGGIFYVFKIKIKEYIRIMKIIIILKAFHITTMYLGMQLVFHNIHI